MEKKAIRFISCGRFSCISCRKGIIWRIAETELLNKNKLSNSVMQEKQDYIVTVDIPVARLRKAHVG